MDQPSHAGGAPTSGSELFASGRTVDLLPEGWPLEHRPARLELNGVEATVRLGREMADRIVQGGGRRAAVKQERGAGLGGRLGGEAEFARGSLAVLLQGPMGSGKTTLVRALLEGLGVPGADCQSPSFLTAIEHRLPGGRVVHVDAYRAPGAESVDLCGLGETLRDAGQARGPDPGERLLVLIEWPERLSLDLHALGLCCTWVQLDHCAGPTGRGAGEARVCVLRADTVGRQHATAGCSSESVGQGHWLA